MEDKAVTTRTITAADDVTISPCVIKHLEPDIDTWNGGGHRLYNLGPIGTKDWLFCIQTRYTRDVDPETGGLAETEEIRNAGFPAPPGHNIDIPDLQDALNQHRPTYNQTTIRSMLNGIWAFAETQMQTDLTSIHLINGTITCELPVDTLTNELDEPATKVGTLLSELATKPDEKHGVPPEGTDTLPRKAINPANHLITDVSHTDAINTDFLMCAGAQFTNVQNWRERALERYHCGVMPSMQLAKVAALLEADDVDTQSAIANRLNKDSSTISQQVQKVREIEAGTEWAAEHVITN